MSKVQPTALGKTHPIKRGVNSEEEGEIGWTLKRVA